VPVPSNDSPQQLFWVIFVNSKITGWYWSVQLMMRPTRLFGAKAPWSLIEILYLGKLDWPERLAY
jgi:hypothetical protein